MKIGSISSIPSMSRDRKENSDKNNDNSGNSFQKKLEAVDSNDNFDSIKLSINAKELLSKDSEELSRPELTTIAPLLYSSGMELNYKNINSMNKLKKMQSIFN